MKVVLFGATGMVGQGVLMECQKDPEVTEILSVGRTPLATSHPKVKELLRQDLYDYTGLEPQLAAYDACFFCLGVSSAGMDEAKYTRITYDLTVAAAQAMVKANPGMTFIYVSGESTDSTEKGSTMWARVKGRTENAVLGLGFRHAYMFRPGFIEPLDGIRPKSNVYRVAYAALRPLTPIVKWAFRGKATTTRLVGRAMINAVKLGSEKKVLLTTDINELGAR